MVRGGRTPGRIYTTQEQRRSESRRARGSTLNIYWFGDPRARETPLLLDKYLDSNEFAAPKDWWFLFGDEKQLGIWGKVVKGGGSVRSTYMTALYRCVGGVLHTYASSVVGSLVCSLLVGTQAEHRGRLWGVCILLAMLLVIL